MTVCLEKNMILPYQLLTCARISISVMLVWWHGRIACLPCSHRRATSSRPFGCKSSCLCNSSLPSLFGGLWSLPHLPPQPERAKLAALFARSINQEHYFTSMFLHLPRKPRKHAKYCVPFSEENSQESWNSDPFRKATDFPPSRSKLATSSTRPILQPSESTPSFIFHQL